jgi:NAD(P) transhydrogenase subunit alpha
MSTALLTDLTIFILALLVGIEVIGKVPATLHTPLMSATNSIHGIVLAGALLIGVTSHTVVGYILAFVAAVFASANVVGGYVVTERMLKMFRRKAPAEGPATKNTATENTASENTGAAGTGALNGAKGLKGLLSKAGKAGQ